MKRVEILESQRTPVRLNSDQATALSEMGRRLASKAEWWGDADTTSEGSVIEVSRDHERQASILVRDAVGVICVDDIQIVVAPKIPQDHFLYLASQSAIIPRVDAQRARTLTAPSLWEVLAHWFVQAVEALLRGELARGYRETSDELTQPRGRIVPLGTAMAYYQGRPAFLCEFEEFSEDIALNRLIRAGCELVAASAILEPGLRKRARSATSRMSNVGKLHHSDLRATVDRLTQRYSDAVAFAKVLLRGGGTRIAHDAARGWCFLIRTPELMEAGIRAVLSRLLAPRFDVRKEGRLIPNTHMTLNPDLVFGSVAVGDVKYKVLTTDWNRSDLYQSVAFAVGYDCKEAALVGFSNSEERQLPPTIQLGQIRVVPFAWDASDNTDPDVSAETLARDVCAFLEDALELETHTGVIRH